MDGDAVGVQVNVTKTLPVPTQDSQSEPPAIPTPPTETIITARLVAPVPKTKSTAGHPVGGIPTLQPVAVRSASVAWDYSQPIAASSVPQSDLPSPNGYTSDQKQSFGNGFINHRIGVLSTGDQLGDGLFAHHHQSDVGMMFALEWYF